MPATTYSGTGPAGQQPLTPTDIRLRMASNGWVPLPNDTKLCLLRGWPSVEATPEAIEQWRRRERGWPDTGLRIDGDLCVFDLDINDPIADGIADALEARFSWLADAMLRFGKGYKRAWFFRVDEPFIKMRTRSWLAPGTIADDGAHMVEVFGSGAARQFAVYGAHTRSDAGEALISYEWVGDREPLNTRPEELPTAPKSELFAAVDMVEELFAAAQWEFVKQSKKGEVESDQAFDLTDAMAFDCNDGVSRSLAELQAVAGEHGLRCSASWLEGEHAKRTDRCLVGVTHSGTVFVHESASGVTHLPASAAAPVPLDKTQAIDTKVIAEKLQRLAEMESERKTRRRLELRSEDTLVQAAGKLVQSYALCAALTTPVVPIWTDDVSSGLTMANFRLLVAPWSEPAVGAQGQPLKTRISPADLWVNSEQRVTVAGLRMRPDQPRPTFKEGGETYVNVYRPVAHPLAGGDPWGGIALLEQIIPDPAERRWLRQWTAYKYLNPGVPGPAVLMVARDAFGTGRSTWGDLLKLVFGARHVNTISFDHFAGRTTQSQYTEWQADSLIVLVNESSTADNGSNYRTKHDTYERLKEIVDPRPQERLILGKYVKAYRAQVCASYCIFTNNPDALPLPAGDRRFAVLTNGEPRDVAFWEGVNEWMRVPENIGAFVRWLEATDLSDYSPFAPPPATTAKETMTDLSASPMDHAFEEAVRFLPGEVLIPEQIVTAMREYKEVHSAEFPDRWEAIARRLVQRKLYRVGVKDGGNWTIRYENKKYPLYARTQRQATVWTSVEGEALRREALRSGLPNASRTIGDMLSGLKIVTNNGEKP